MRERLSLTPELMAIVASSFKLPDEKSVSHPDYPGRSEP